MNPNPTLGELLRSPAIQQRKAQARALMHLGLVEHGARMRYTPIADVPARLRQIADELEQIGPQLAQQLTEEQAA